MAFIGTILQEVIKLRNMNMDKVPTIKTQKTVLRKLIKTAKNTEFGKHYQFDKIARSKNFFDEFRRNLPIHDYNKIYNEWWYRSLNDEPNICWPGKSKYYGLTSGTSESTSKRVPITTSMIHAIQKTSFRQILSLANLPQTEIPKSFYQKSVLMVGGSIELVKIGSHFEGDLSGILAGRLPIWFQNFYKPGRSIASIRDWETKLNEIVKKAPSWDIGAIAGVPSWIQLLLQKIIDYHKLASIHDIWPNLKVYVHGGVSFTPYMTSFRKLLNEDLIYLETYLASEGFLAYQRGLKPEGMQLELKSGIFFEFIPFNDENFDNEGTIRNNPQTLLLNEVKTNTDYAILISTCAGAWRYLIGDTIRFTNLANFTIEITGRIKHFLNLCGEHLSIDNMNKSIELVSKNLNFEIQEYTVTAMNYESLFAHKWYIGTDDCFIDNATISRFLDKTLCLLNDDYAVERKSALKKVEVEVIPLHFFYDFMKSIGKEGGQNKFPRVLKGELLFKWEVFLGKFAEVKVHTKK